MTITRPFAAKVMRALACLTVLVLVSRSNLSARVDFNPVIFLAGYTTDNVAFANADQPKVSDTSASLGATLPLRRESRRGWLEFLYTGSYTKYEQATVFDTLNHFAGFRLSNEPNPRSNLTLDACFVSTQDQDIGVGSCTDLFISERTKRQLFGVDFEYRQLFARRWSWSFSLEAASANFEPIEGFDPGDTSLVVEDKLGYLARIGVRRTFGRRLSFGTSYAYSFVEQEVSPSVQTHILRVDIEHEATRRLKYRLDIGVYDRSSNDVEDPTQGEYRNQGIDFYFELQYGESKGYEIGPVRLDLNAGITPTAGGAIQGTSTDVFGRVALSPRRPGKWDWGVSGQYAVRVPTRTDELNLNTLTGEFRVERAIVRVFGLRLRGFFRDQASEDPTQTVSYYRVEFGMTYYPLGRKRATSE